MADDNKKTAAARGKQSASHAKKTAPSNASSQIVAFSADLFCRALSLGLPIGFQPSASAKGSGQALARGVPAKDCCKGFYGVFRMIFCDG